jgi:hypothetical protein
VPTIIPELLARAMEKRADEEADGVVAAQSLEPSEPHVLLSIAF